MPSTGRGLTSYFMFSIARMLFRAGRETRVGQLLRVKRRIQRFENTNKSPDSRLRAWSADSQDRCELCSFGINRITSAQSLIAIVRSGTSISLGWLPGGSGHFEGIRHIRRCGDSGLSALWVKLKKIVCFFLGPCFLNNRTLW